MELAKAKEIALRLMRVHNLINNGWKFKFDTSKRRFGLCSYTKKEISLSSLLVSLNKEEQVRDTILHEIAHAIVGFDNGHNHIWKQKAMEIGCTGERCYNPVNVNRVRGNYEALCKSCGHVHIKYKKPKVGKRTSCGNCSSTFNVKYLLEYKAV